MVSKIQEMSPGYLFVNICKLRRNRTNALLTGAGLYAGQDIVLYHLSLQEGQTVSELAEKACLRLATISNTVRRMEAVGLLRKDADQSDGRTTRVYFTKEGRTALATVTEVWKELEKLTARGLTAEELATLTRLLAKVRDNLA
jgi:DNA-binding MarR family transcriptional regulator